MCKKFLNNSYFLSLSFSKGLFYTIEIFSNWNIYHILIEKYNYNYL